MRYVSRNIEWGDMRGNRKIETVEQMTDEYRSVLIKILWALASTEFASVEQHQPWINQGPTPEDRYIQAQICSDEAHQGMEDCRLLEMFGEEGRAMVLDLMGRKMGTHPLEAFNIPFESWVDLCAFCSLMDGVAHFTLTAFENSSFGPLARAMTSMMMEEKFHMSFGRNRVRLLMKDPTYLRVDPETVRTAVWKWYPRAMDTFGRDESRFSDLAVQYGIRKYGNRELRERWKADTDAFLEEVGIAVPAADYDRHFV